MDSFVVRIYRRGGDAGSEIAGLVERVGDGKRKAFASSTELWAFLAASPARARRARFKAGGKNG